MQGIQVGVSSESVTLATIIFNNLLFYLGSVEIHHGIRYKA
jgi:hypothetical protein